MGSNPRKLRRVILRALAAVSLCVLVLLVVGGLVLYRLTSAAPAWWAPVDPSDPAAADSARAVENTVSTLSHKARPPGEPATWTLSLSPGQANAWLASRLRAWME